MLLFSACSKDNDTDTEQYNKQTILVYMPWSGDKENEGLYPIFLENIDSIQSGIKAQNGLKNSRLLVFLSKSATQSELFEISYHNHKLQHIPIKTYNGNDYTTVKGIAQIINDTKTTAQALNYAMIIGCHGTGWTYKEHWQNYPYYAKPYLFTRTQQPQKTPRTRFFGSVNDYHNYATNIEELAKGIALTHTKLQYIMFDDCYMANIETAYTLKDVTNFLIASTSEIMAIGMPYAQMWSSLNSATPKYDDIAKHFYNFYSKYDTPCGAIGVIDCRQVEPLAHIMKDINQRYTLDESVRDSLQILGGFSPTIFFDLGSYVDHLCENKALKEQFMQQLNRVVRSKSHTKEIYTALGLIPQNFIPIKTFSGITTSAPSLHVTVEKGRKNTAWWKATH